MLNPALLPFMLYCICTVCVWTGIVHFRCARLRVAMTTKPSFTRIYISIQPSIYPYSIQLYSSPHVSHSAVTGNRHKVSAIASKNLFHIRKKSNICHQINPPQPNHTMQLVVWNETCSTFISFHLGLFSCTFHFNFHLPSMYPLWQLCTGKLY